MEPVHIYSFRYYKVTKMFYNNFENLKKSDINSESSEVLPKKTQFMNFAL